MLARQLRPFVIICVYTLNMTQRQRQPSPNELALPTMWQHCYGLKRNVRHPDCGGAVCCAGTYLKQHMKIVLLKVPL